MVKTEAGEKMKEENPNKALPKKADINKDGKFEEWEKARHKAIEASEPEMNCGGLMGTGMGVVVGIEDSSGNHIPAGSLPEEVADDVPAMLSEGEYVVPADVVRWHGVKTFESLRNEAKMGMGLMAKDGRIAEVDSEEPDYEIEEKDKPKVEKTKVKVVEANEGIDVQTPGNYTLASKYDPETNRIVYYYLDPATGQEVSQEDFRPELSTRFSPSETVMREVYDSADREIPDCGEGFVYDEEVGACVPIGPVESPAPEVDVSGDGDGPEPTPETQYSDRLGTKIAEALGPQSAEELADQPGDTLAEQAMSRMTTPSDAKPLGLNPIALAITGIQKFADEVGASRAAITRANEITKIAEGLDPSKLPQTYNFSFNPDTASFERSGGTTKISELQRSDSGKTWASDYDHIDPDTGKKVDPSKMSQIEFEDWIDKMDEAEFGKTDPNRKVGMGSGSIERPSWLDDTTSTDDTSTPKETRQSTTAQSYAATQGGDRKSDDNEDAATSYGRDRENDPDVSELASGGYVTKKNKPKVVTMKYSKGSK